VGDRVAASVVRLAGEVCGVPLFAGGVVVDEGLVLTAAHVVAGAEGPLEVRLASGGSRPAAIVGFDPDRDLAALAVTGLDSVAAQVADGVAGESGMIVSFSRDGARTDTPFVVERQISATGEDIYGEGDVSRQALELAAEIEPGMSGAGAFDDDGDLVGLVFAESRGRPITYAVAATELRSFLGTIDPSITIDSGHC